MYSRAFNVWQTVVCTPLPAENLQRDHGTALSLLLLYYIQFFVPFQIFCACLSMLSFILGVNPSVDTINSLLLITKINNRLPSTITYHISNRLNQPPQSPRARWRLHHLSVITLEVQSVNKPYSSISWGYQQATM